MEINNRKRVRVESDSDSESHQPDSKRVASVTESDPTQPESNSQYDSVVKTHELYQVDSDFEVDGIPHDILDILENPETVNEHEPANQDLDSVIKSFEEEILNPSPVVKSNSGESQPELGYLLEASDDELGIPPTEDTSTNEPLINLTVDNSSNSFQMGNMIEFENEFPSYDVFEFGLSESSPTVENNSNNNVSSNNEFVTVDGLFDYSESWRPESLPAL